MIFVIDIKLEEEKKTVIKVEKVVYLYKLISLLNKNVQFFPYKLFSLLLIILNME
jgi:hypothetical protein